MRSRRVGCGRMLVLLGILAVTAAGCFNPFDPRVASNRGISEQAPAPTSARNVLELFKWCWEHRAYEEYRQIFTDDFRFFSAYVDPDSPDTTRIETREDELTSAKHLFVGGKADEPPANRITLDFSSDLVAFPDPRAGKTYPVHQVIQTSVTLNVDTDAESFRVVGDARFYVVRGDSAVIPLDLGVGRDENRWYIERWEDLTGGPAAVVNRVPELLRSARVDGVEAMRPSVRVRVRPFHREGAETPVSWGFLKRLYR